MRCTLTAVESRTAMPRLRGDSTALNLTLPRLGFSIGPPLDARVQPQHAVTTRPYQALEQLIVGPELDTLDLDFPGGCNVRTTPSITNPNPDHYIQVLRSSPVQDAIARMCRRFQALGPGQT